MNKTLYVPEHIAEKEKKKSAYVKKDERVLDPSLLDVSLSERLPQPTGWRILVMPYAGKATSDGGILIPDQIRDREALATVVAYVLRVGPLAYQDENKFGADGEPWCKKGDWVCIGRYAGARFKIDGGEVRIINDDEVIATIKDPDDIKHVQKAEIDHGEQIMPVEENKIEIGDSEESSVEIDLSEDKSSEKPKEVKQEPPEVTVEEAASGEELEEYSSGVKSRIDKLTKRMREEERQKQSAVQYAENVRTENEDLKKRLENLDKGFQEEFGTRVTTQIQAAKQLLKEAHETGDVDKIVDVQEALSELAIEKGKVRRTPEDTGQEVAQQQAPVQQAPVQQAPAKADPKAEDWATRNEWFGNDEVMTYAAFGVHRRLVEDEQFDPQSDEYYSELDKRLQTEFPHKLGIKPKTGGSKKVASAETSASRNRGGRKTVRLTPSQVAIAKKLNVPLEEYAKYVKQELIMTQENTARQKTPRTPRDNQTRVKETRKEPWRPPSMLAAPPAPEGYKHRWIRESVMGFDDRKNVSARSREGYELVRGEEFPDFDIPTVDDGKHAGVIGVGGLLLARVPEEIVESRNAYFRGQTRDQMTAVDNELAREQHPAMPISRPDRSSSVTFGGPQNEDQEKTKWLIQMEVLVFAP